MTQINKDPGSKFYPSETVILGILYAINEAEPEEILAVAQSQLRRTVSQPS